MQPMIRSAGSPASRFRTCAFGVLVPSTVSRRQGALHLPCPPGREGLLPLLPGGGHPIDARQGTAVAHHPLSSPRKRGSRTFDRPRPRIKSGVTRQRWCPASRVLGGRIKEVKE